MTTLIKPLKGKKKKDCNSGDNSHGLINDQLDVGIYDSKVCGVVSWSSRQVCTGAFNTMGNTAGGDGDDTNLKSRLSGSVYTHC